MWERLFTWFTSNVGGLLTHIRARYFLRWGRGREREEQEEHRPD